MKLKASEFKFIKEYYFNLLDKWLIENIMKLDSIKTFFEIEQKLDDYFAHCTVEIILDEAGYEIN